MNEIVTPISIARRLREHGLDYFSPSILAAWLSITPAATYRLVESLCTEGLATKVEKGKYLLLGLEPERVLSNPFYIASHLVDPAYISYWSALHYHGFTTQVPHHVFCATTRKKRPVIFAGQTFSYVTLQPHKFFGYRREQLGDLPVLIADEAKAIIDSLNQSRYAGGMLEVGLALQRALPDLDLDLLADYAIRMADKSLSSRLGYWLAVWGRPAQGLPVSSSPVALDPAQPRKGKVDDRWPVIVNLSIPGGSMEGVI
jgi:predicted transcriptional regulator of viral defense system